MATYALTVSTNALGLGVISGATVRVERRRIAIADTYPPINNLIQIAQATNSSGIEFCQYSRYWRKELDGFYTIATDSEYELISKLS